MLTPHSLLAAQIVAHIAFVYLLFTGTMAQWTIVFCVYFLSGCIGMTMTYHRLLSHKSWSAPNWLEKFGVLCATIGMTGSALSWVAIHRKHHKFTDTDQDPHSPKHKGFIYCQWFSMFESVEFKYILDLSKKEFYKFQHKYYFLIIFIYALCLLSAFGPKSLIYGWLAPACLLWNAGSSIITVSHIFGQKAHPLPNESRNSWILGFLVWGEGWHNNHHNKSDSPYFFEKWWQIDLGGYFIALFQKK